MPTAFLRQADVREKLKDTHFLIVVQYVTICYIGLPYFSDVFV